MFTCCESPSSKVPVEVAVPDVAEEPEPTATEPELAVEEETEPVVEPEPVVEEPAPPAEITSFLVTLEKNGQELGLSVDAFGMGLQVLLVKPEGAAKRYDAEAPSEAPRIQQDDFIVAVNGVEGNANDKLFQALRKSDKLELKVVRPKQLQIKLEKPSDAKTYGLDMNHTKVGTSLMVRGVKEGGAVATYNSSAPLEQQILPQDFIKSANGAESPNSIMDQFQKETVLDLVLLRLPASA